MPSERLPSIFSPSLQGFPTQFEQVLFGLKPLAGLIASEAQGKRAIELLPWLEGPTGKGYPSLLEVLANLGIPLP